MSQKKMLQFSKGALLLLLPWIGGLVLGEISDDFSQCLDFFYEGTPPQGITGEEYQPICQRYENQYRFASLYHRQHRTPLYSAYILQTAADSRPNKHWKYEPQLASPGNTAEMQEFKKNIPVDQNVKDSQAVIEDYDEKFGFTKGHLNPSSHQKTKDDSKATFTLTNAVPQKEGSNAGPWQKLEEDMLNKLKDCKEPMYVITGVIPYKSGARWINNRVSVPEYMWSAYCCPSYSASLPESVKPFFPTYAAVGRNDPNSDKEIVPVNGYGVKRMSLEDLEGILKERLNMPEISLFKDQCK